MTAPESSAASGRTTGGASARCCWPASSRRRWSVVGLDGAAVDGAPPAIADGLDAGLAAQQWVAAAYSLALGALLLLGGSLGDVYDRWRVFGLGTVDVSGVAFKLVHDPHDTGVPRGRQDARSAGPPDGAECRDLAVTSMARSTTDIGGKGITVPCLTRPAAFWHITGGQAHAMEGRRP